MSFHKRSYDRHASSYSRIEASEIEMYKNWFESDTIDLWRHLRMLEVLNPFLKENDGAKWLTVGDGRYGTSAIYIGKHGGKALPTDIDTQLLKIAKNEGLIADYRLENAENLSFLDEEFDFSFCKEAFHHFPRPYIALYEMLRCTKNAIIFTEPRDWIPSPIPRRILQLVKNFLKKLTGKNLLHSDEGNYEEVGNYIYTISEREFQKIALGLNLPAVAFKKFHDVYIEGVEGKKMNKNAKLFQHIRKRIRQNNIGCLFGLNGRNRVSAIIFKKMPSDSLKMELKKIGFDVLDLPRNPYLA